MPLHSFLASSRLTHSIRVNEAIGDGRVPAACVWIEGKQHRQSSKRISKKIRGSDRAAMALRQARHDMGEYVDDSDDDD
jgi:hypothetical protein